MKFLNLEETLSTNSYASARAAELEDWTVVSARRQTAGRGQRGNGWEAEEGKNLTFSVFFRPENFRARDQFALSEAVALAVVETLAGEGVEARIKWPNDIYVGDRKICGILIEHAVMGMNVSSTVAGVGLNVNQARFLSDAPNPVSLIQLTGRESDLTGMLERLAELIRRNCEAAYTEEGRRELHRRFIDRLWRGDGRLHPFRLPDGTRFEARIADIEPAGFLLLETADGEMKRFAFKEVIFSLPDKIPVPQGTE